ncbi:hypothetical protein MUK42_17621 [Musa troglodytarum]|uniref:Uncharacterized protein n=1 Tax=Musa troglodytarum TaxID=320322 RepID=A0A9E7KAH4_9LILI|nr:hypothetical protein MUK42_17621 [Musa troglodytarum]
MESYITLVSQKNTIVINFVQSRCLIDFLCTITKI